MTASRRHIRKILVPCIATVSILLSCATSSWADPSQKQLAPDKATAVIHCSYAPVTYWDPNTGKPSGFAVDIINSAAKRAGLEISYICKPGWQEMITSVTTGEADISVLLRSEEREKILLFSSPIDITYLSYFARSQSMIDPDAVPLGYTVGAIRGSRSYEYLKNLPGLKLSLEGSYQEGIFSLLAGKIDLFAGEESMIGKQAREALLEDRIRKIGKPFSEQQRCLVVRKDKVQLQERLNNSLKGFVGSPEYQRIYLKWFGAPAPYWTINKILAVSGSFLLIAVCGMAYWRYISILRINRELVRTFDERKQAEASLRESEDKFRSIFEQATDGIMIADVETRKNIEANNAICVMLGYTREELVGLRVDDIHPKNDLPAIQEAFQKQLRGEISLASEVPMLRKDGSIIYADINATRVMLGGKQCLVGIFRNITERKQAETLLKTREKQLADSQRIAHIGSWEHNLTTGQVVWSDELFRLMGLDPQKDPADFKRFFEMIHPDDRPVLKKAIDETVMTGKRFSVDYRFNLPDGGTRILHAQAELRTDETGTQDILSGTGQDITERRNADDLVLRSLKEKEVLLKEIHHRVKNNMQVIYSLLNLQAKGIEDAVIRAMFEEARNRVHSMALIHEKLYKSADLAHIDFKEYLTSLLYRIADTYKRKDVVFSVEMEPLALDVNVGIPCGLIVNELVSNSLKHAFPDGKKGTIRVGINKNGNGSNVLVVADNGVSIPETVDFRNTTSLGLQLVTVLSGQINGTISLSKAEGTEFIITFPETPAQR